MTGALVTLDLAAVEAADQTYRISTAVALDPLCRSMAALGLLVPLLLAGESPPYTLLSGFRRLEAARRLGWRRITARLFSGADDPLRSAQAAVAENALQRALNPLEQGRALELLAGRCSAEALPRVAAACGLEGNPEHWSRLRRLIHLPSAVQQGLLDETIAYPVALFLQGLPAADAELFANLFSKLKLSLNKQRQVIEYATEICISEGIGLHRLLADAKLLQPLEDPALDRNRKGAWLRAALRSRRYPGLAAAERAFQASIAQISLGEGVRLAPPPDFEGSAFTLSQTFDSFEAFQRQRRRIDALVGHPAFLALF
jgi:hypothetical protein